MRVDHDPGAALASKQVVDGNSERLAFDIPQRHINRRDCRHGDRTAPPVSSAIKVMPYILGLKRIPPNQARYKMIFQVTGHGELAPVERRIPETINTLVGFDL